MLRGKGGERCTWYMAGNLGGLDRSDDAELAMAVMQMLQEGNVRAKGNKTHHFVISFHPEDRRLTPVELEDVGSCTLRSSHVRISVFSGICLAVMFDWSGG